MKQVFTISLDEEIATAIRQISLHRKDRFRNKSHLVEEAIRQFIERGEWE